MHPSNTRQITLPIVLFASVLILNPYMSWLSTANAQGMDLARYMPAKAESQSSGFPAELANDGMVSPISRWVSEQGPHRLTIELPGRFEIGSANVFTGNFGQDAVVNFTLQYQTENGWADIPGAKVENNEKTQLRIIFDQPVTTDRIRFVSNDPGPASVAELAVFPPNGGKGFPIDEAVELEAGLVPFVTADSQQPGDHRPFLAADGLVDPASAWVSGPGEGPHWLQVRFHSNRGIAYAHIYTGKGDDAIHNFHLEQLDNNDNWQTIPGTAVSNNNKDTVLLAFDPVKTTGIRLVIDDAGAAQVRELVLLPPNNGDGYPAGTQVTIAPPTQTMYSTYGDNLYLIKQPSSGDVIGIIDGQLTLANFKGTDNQQYHLINLIGTDDYRIVSRGTNHCLEVAGASTEPGAVVREGKYHALDYQLWRIEDGPGDQKQLINVHSGLALAFDANDKQLVQRPAASAHNMPYWEIAYHRHFPKKGLAEQGAGPHINSMRAKSIYNWGLDPAGDNPPGLQHEPMLWGNAQWDQMALDRAKWYATAEPVYLMGFNEPDHTDQSDIPVERCLEVWSGLEAVKLPLASLCPSNWNNGWARQWFDQAEARDDRFDVTAVHYYITSGPNADQFMNHIRGAYERYHKPIWLTEWNIVNWGGPAPWSDEQVYTWMAEVLYRMEKADYVDRYFFFPFAVDWPNGKPGAPWEIDRLSLRPLGRLFGAWDSDTTLHTDTWYYLHNKASHHRLKQSGDTVAMAPITDIHPDTDWYLQHAGKDRYTIVSRDGDLKLGVKDKQPAMFPGKAVGSAVEWAFVPQLHGWYFIEHPASGLRLQFTPGEDGPKLVTKDHADADTLWRVIKPYLPGAQVGQTDNMPPDAPFWVTARDAQNIVRLDWKSTGPESDFDHYEIHRATQSGGPYEMIADNVKQRTYADTSVKNGQRYFYVVRSVDMSGNKSGFSRETTSLPGNWIKVGSRDKSIVYTGQWRTDPRDRWLEYRSETPGSEASLTFTGPGVRFYTTIRDSMGILQISLDGKPVDNVDCYLGSQRKHAMVYEATGLPDGEHTITVKLTGRKNPKAFHANGVVDAFEVLSYDPDTTPPAVPTNVAVQTDIDRIDLQWSANPEIDLAGYTVLRADDGDTKLKPIAENLHDTHYTDRDVKLGRHYTYAVTSTDASGNVSEPSPPIKTSPGKWIKVDDTDKSVAYKGTWGTYTQNPSYGYSEHYSETQGAEAEFTFVGNKVRFFGYQRRDLGKADILLDGKLVQTVDCFSDYTGFDTLVYESGELPEGKHTLTVRVRGDKNNRSDGVEFIIDAFEYKTTKP